MSGLNLWRKRNQVIVVTVTDPNTGQEHDLKISPFKFDRDSRDGQERVHLNFDGDRSIFAVELLENI